MSTTADVLWISVYGVYAWVCVLWISDKSSEIIAFSLLTTICQYARPVVTVLLFVNMLELVNVLLKCVNMIV